MTSETARSSGTAANRSASSLGTWILGLSVSLLSANAFVMLSAGVLLGLVVTLGLPMIVANVLAVPVLAAALWIGIWVCCRVVEVEKNLARGGGTPGAAVHLLKPWITTDR
jgi:hypothetical protein